MTPAVQAEAPKPQAAAGRVTKGLLRAKLEELDKKPDAWPGISDPVTFTSNSTSTPYISMGNAKVGSQTYNAGSLFASTSLTR